MARWVRRRDRAGRVLAVANQTPGALERYGVTREEADRACPVDFRRDRPRRDEARPVLHGPIFRDLERRAVLGTANPPFAPSVPRLIHLGG